MPQSELSFPRIFRAFRQRNSAKDKNTKYTRSSQLFKEEIVSHSRSTDKPKEIFTRRKKL